MSYTRGDLLSVKSRTIFIADNLHILRGIQDNFVDLIYLDPPFNKKKNFAAPIGSKAAGASFKDIWTLDDIDIVWWGEIANKNPSLYTVLDAIGQTGGTDSQAYSIYMSIRFIEMQRILKPTGSLYLHCDPLMSHYLKIVLDSIFKHTNFVNEIVWKRHTSSQKGSQYAARSFGSNHDIILVYAKDHKKSKFDIPKKFPTTKEEIEKKFPNIDPDGRRWKDDSAHIWSNRSMGSRPNLCYMWRGFTNPHPSGWRLKKERMEEEYQKGNIEIVTKPDGTKKLVRKVYLKDYKGENMGDLWDDIKPALGKENCGYPTQKPLELLRRIISTATNKGDIVLDPFCGCATTCIAAEELDRKWIGIDLSSKAETLIKQRLHSEYPLDQYTEKASQLIVRDKPPVIHGTSSKNIKELLYGQQKGLCNGCNVHFQYRNLTIDHKMPRSKGGADIDENKQLLCGSCNSIKGSRLDTDQLKAELIRQKII